METIRIKEEAKRLIDKLPEGCTWDERSQQIGNFPSSGRIDGSEVNGG